MMKSPVKFLVSKLSKKSAYSLTMAVFLAGALALSMPAEAQKRGSRDRTSNHISWTQLVQKLENDGYRIREIEMKRNGWEVEVIQNGERYDLRLDARGNIIRRKRDY